MIFLWPPLIGSQFSMVSPPPPPFPPKTTWFPPSLPQEINTDWSLGTNRNELTVPSTENILVSDAESAQPNRAQARKHLYVQKAHISLWKIARKIYKLFVFMSYYALRLIPILPLLQILLLIGTSRTIKRNEQNRCNWTLITPLHSETIP